MNKTITTYFLFLCVFLLSEHIFAQDIILPKQGAPITAYELVVSDTYIFYQTSVDSTAQTMRIAKDDILMIRKADGTALNLTESTSAVAAQPEKEEVQEDRFPIVDIENYHGFLLQKGNCVYIPTDSKIDYERAGQEATKLTFQKENYWQVVDKPEQAHFIVIYNTCTEGQDFSQIVFRTRGEYAKQSYVISSQWAYSNIETDMCFPSGYRSDETMETNSRIACFHVPTIIKSFTKYYYDISSYYKWYAKKGSLKAQAWIIP